MGGREKGKEKKGGGGGRKSEKEIVIMAIYYCALTMHSPLHLSIWENNLSLFKFCVM